MYSFLYTSLPALPACIQFVCGCVAGWVDNSVHILVMVINVERSVDIQQNLSKDQRVAKDVMFIYIHIYKFMFSIFYNFEGR